MAGVAVECLSPKLHVSILGDEIGDGGSESVGQKFYCVPIVQHGSEARIEVEKARRRSGTRIDVDDRQLSSCVPRARLDQICHKAKGFPVRRKVIDTMRSELIWNLSAWNLLGRAAIDRNSHQAVGSEPAYEVHPLTIWRTDRIGIKRPGGKLLRRRPVRVTTPDIDRCAGMIGPAEHQILIAAR